MILDKYFIYFVLKGAEKVIAIEPFPYTFEILDKNLSINGVLERISIVNCAIGGKTGTMRVSPLLKNTVGTIASNGPECMLIDVLTIHDVLRDFNLNDKNAVLKMDCEGCE